MTSQYAILTAGLFALSQVMSRGADTPPGLAFAEAEKGEYRFDTGVLRGMLRAGGKSLGLSAVVHVPSGIRLDRSNGLLSYYRVFTKDTRYGGGAWDWPSTARLRGDGAVETHWAPGEGRPIDMTAIYRWSDATTVDLLTVVKATKDLPRFEVFLASYFNEGFTNALVYVRANPEAGGQPGLMPVRKPAGDWQMFPRDDAAVTLITDGRWKLEPNPVNWTIMPRLAKPVAVRCAPQSGLTAILTATPEECFAIASPHETEGHYSTYLSLFGRDVRAGETVRARTRLHIALNPSERELLGGK